MFIDSRTVLLLMQGFSVVDSSHNVFLSQFDRFIIEQFSENGWKAIFECSSSNINVERDIQWGSGECDQWADVDTEEKSSKATTLHHHKIKKWSGIKVQKL